MMQSRSDFDFSKKLAAINYDDSLSESNKKVVQLVDFVSRGLE
jgi:hypothetical protein